jgi:hypothetical protein
MFTSLTTPLRSFRLVIHVVRRIWATYGRCIIRAVILIIIGRRI